jgi:hypothetical protein
VRGEEPHRVKGGKGDLKELDNLRRTIRRNDRADFLVHDSDGNLRPS